MTPWNNLRSRGEDRQCSSCPSFQATGRGPECSRRGKAYSVTRVDWADSLGCQLVNQLSPKKIPQLQFLKIVDRAACWLSTLSLHMRTNSMGCKMHLDWKATRCITCTMIASWQNQAVKLVRDLVKIPSAKIDPCRTEAETKVQNALRAHSIWAWACWIGVSNW